MNFNFRTVGFKPWLDSWQLMLFLKHVVKMVRGQLGNNSKMKVGEKEEEQPMGNREVATEMWWGEQEKLG